MNRQEEIELLQELLREGRGMVKDLRQAIKAAGAAEKQLRQAVSEQVDIEIRDEIRKGLDVYAVSLKEAIDDGVKHCAGELAKLEKLILTGNTRGRGENLIDLAEQALAEAEEDTG